MKAFFYSTEWEESEAELYTLYKTTFDTETKRTVDFVPHFT